MAVWRDPGVGRILGLMAPALLGVSVAQISLIINTQIASHLTPGSVTWLGYADRLMEFPTALLGVALGVVLLPALTQAKASGDLQRYSELIDDGLRWVLVLALPCALALLIFAKPLVSVLFHYGAFTDRDLMQTSLALVGYGVGLIGLVAIKVLAPGFYASQDTRTPMHIALGVLALTQLLNLVLVPWLGHAGLALAIGLGALVNASALCVGLIRQGRYQPRPGWVRYSVQVVLACAVLALPLLWFAQVIDWAAWRVTPWARVAALAVALLTAAITYGVALWVLRVPLQTLWRR
jgi:putative peptidoglycan lipid II flippase